MVRGRCCGEEHAMDLEHYAEESAAAINTALEKYRFDKLALQDAEQTEALAREANERMTDPEEPPIEGDQSDIEGLRASFGEQRRALIRLQNDRFRITFLGGQVMMTIGVKGRGDVFVKGCLDAVRAFDTFNQENDPYGEHDFGILEVDGQKVYWKIDAYDHDCRYGSEDPADPALTLRVLTFCLPEEY
jgi:hypothetical protein